MTNSALLKAYKNCNAVVTGAADGIGRALVNALLDEGLNVAAIDISEVGLKELRGQSKQAEGTLCTYCCDVANLAELTATHENILRQMGDISLLWVNAGVGIAGSVLSAKRSNLQWLYEVNLWGAINTVRAFIPSLIDGTRSRHVGFTASSACLRQIAGSSTAYAASKYAFWGMAESIRSDLEDTEVSVSILFPGLTNTKIWDSARVRPDKFGGARKSKPEAGARWEGGISADTVAKSALQSISTRSTYRVIPVKDTVEEFDRFASILKEGFY